MLGDACLVHVPAASEAVLLGLRLTEQAANTHEALDVRIGVHTGTAIERGGDWFGSAVNLAARVVRLADAGEVMVSQAAREASARDVADVLFEDCGAHEIRHLAQPMRIFRAVTVGAPGGGGTWAVDPVCHMRVELARRATLLTHEGVEYSFCSGLCAGAFARTPERYARDALRATR